MNTEHGTFTPNRFTFLRDMERGWGEEGRKLQTSQTLSWFDSKTDGDYGKVNNVQNSYPSEKAKHFEKKTSQK